MLLTPAVGGMARMLGVVDRPGDRRRANTRTVPRLGGLALFLGIFVPALAFLDLNPAMRGLLLGAAVATTVGAIDDFRGLRWWEKLGGQVLAASIAVGFGVWVHQFTFPVVGVHELPAWIGAPLTVLFIVAVMNMVNFLDGLDGLAAGVCCDLGRDVRADRARPRPREPGDPRRDRARRDRSASSGTTSIRRASSWATRARCCSATRSPRSPSKAS